MSKRKFNKVYIGKGKPVINKKTKEVLPIMQVSLSMEDVLKNKHEYEGKEYITFRVSEMKAKDDWGRTHTCYVEVLEEVSEEEPATEKEETADVPF